MMDGNEMKHITMATVVASLLSCHQLDDMSNDANNRVPGASITVKQNGDIETVDGRRIGVLLTSHGDIDDFDEIEGYLRTAFLKNVGVPCPALSVSSSRIRRTGLLKMALRNNTRLSAPPAIGPMLTFKLMQSGDAC